VDRPGFIFVAVNGSTKTIPLGYAPDPTAADRRCTAATALLDRGYGRPAQSLDLHLSADAITKRLSDMTDAELATLEQRMIASTDCAGPNGSGRAVTAGSSAV
jgi:hypothetical protein